MYVTLQDLGRSVWKISSHLFTVTEKQIEYDNLREIDGRINVKSSN